VSPVTVGSIVPQIHTCPTTSFEHLRLQRMVPSTHRLPSTPPSPAVQAVIVHDQGLINPQLAAVIRVCVEVVHPARFDFQVACPTHCEIVPLLEGRPKRTRVPVPHTGDLANESPLALIEIWQPAHSIDLVKRFLHDTRLAVLWRWWWRRWCRSGCRRDLP